MLTITQLTKNFNGNAAVDGVSFDIKSGEVFSLIGPNSSGKTTIVKTITGLLAPDGGKVMVDGKDVAIHPKATKAVTGYVPDEPSVWSSMTGGEFLHFVGALYGMTPEARAKKIAILLPLFALDAVAGERFEDYSRGNKQKFSILAALLHNPKLLVIDEPIVGLDPESATIAKKLFADFAKEGGAVLLVTHTLSVAEEISTRIGVLKKGKLLHVGTLAELRNTSKCGAEADLATIYAALTTTN